MNRLSINEINSDQLDELYAQVNAWRHKAIQRALAISRLTGTVQAVNELAAEEVTPQTDWGNGYRAALAELREVLPAFAPDSRHQPAAHDGPSVAECRDADRRWPLEKEGE